MKLTARKIETLSKPGRYSDGNGLYLQITRQLTKSYSFRFMFRGKAHQMGIGSTAIISLQEARIKALEYKKMLLEKKNPLMIKTKKNREAELAAARSKTFDDCAKMYIEENRSLWRNKKHADQWENTIKCYASPLIGNLSIQDVDKGLVLQILKPIWESKCETASRLRGRLETIIDWATVHGFREGENPARWRGHLDKVLKKRSKIEKVKHHPALNYSQIGEFLNKIRTQASSASLALEFLILTATRSNETRGARWTEVDFEKCIWTVPGSRTKTKTDHRVPLSDRAIDILKHIKVYYQSEYIFPGRRATKPLSDAAFMSIIKKMGYEITAHGFRSTFRDWTSEETKHSREVAEAALAHVIDSKTEAAYRRGDLLEKRRLLMNDWSEFCSKYETNKAIVTQISAEIA